MVEDAGVGENKDHDSDFLKRELEIANYRLNLVEGIKTQNNQKNITFY